MHGSVFFDQNLNGIQDPGEPDLQDTVVVLLKDGQVIATTVTHSPYVFENIAPGTYDLQVMVQPGQVPTTPVILEVSVTVSENCVTGPDFGIYDNNLAPGDQQVTTLVPPDTRFTLSTSLNTVQSSTTGSASTQATTTASQATQASTNSTASSASAARPISGTKPAYTGRSSGALAGLGVLMLLAGAVLTLTLRRRKEA